MVQTFSIEVGGRALSFETGRLAKQASGAVQVTYGETVLLVTACMTEKPREGLDFFPLLVDFEERFYSAGKIPGGFIKREGRPSETAILSARIIDRSIRSLFPEHMRNDVHVVATVLSVDQVNPPNIQAINAASMALTLSEIPWNGPVAALRVGCIDGKFVVNPTEEELPLSTLDLVLAGHMGGITMVEAGAKEVPESLMVDALEFGHEEIKRLVRFQLEVREKAGKPKVEIPAPVRIEALDEAIRKNYYGEIYEAVGIHAKGQRNEKIALIKQKAVETLEGEFPDSSRYIGEVVEELVKKAMRSMTVDERRRADGRTMDQVRPISCEVGVLPRTHGSALFTRGETQALVTTTLGMMGEDEQVLDGLKIDEPSKRFMLHYNFPPYSVGEVRPMRGPGRREIGHGALAERAVRHLMPSEEEFPYIVRVVSDILESNGSSSMASVCGASLALMDAGVPIKRPVAGVAMGLIKEGEKVEILTDIQGLEDHYGDMDFKVTGTEVGITALQMDNKAGGITREILEKALGQAREGRLHILGEMAKVIREPKKELSPYAPRMYTTSVPVDSIRDVIGPGGKVIRGICADTGVKMNVEDDGRIFIAATNEESAKKALQIIRDLTRDAEPGEIFYGKVTRLLSFGAFVEVLPGKEGLLHVSEISTHHVPKLEDAVKPGDMVLVMVKEIDDMNRVNLTRRRLLEKAAEHRLAELYPDAYALELAREERIAKASAAAGSERPRRGEGETRDRRPGGERHDRRGSGPRDRGRGPVERH
ncbi:MAG TPA: polyribonucleotide nucleotidyltransferase [Synergistales bacterium]|nr:polyribonucleotide nucleotidyltransferase [Synergistales bacterium]